MRSFSGKQALITGAASGIGRALTLELAREGARLVLVDIDRAGLHETSRQLSEQGVDATVYVCDLTDRDQVAAVCERVRTECGGVDLLVNNAGIAYYGRTTAMTDEQWDRVMDVNLHAPVQMTRELLPSLLERPDSHVVNMCSIAGLVAGGRFAAYHVSKFGLVGFSEALRAEFGRRGLGVTAVCPGPVRTRLYDAAAAGGGSQVPVPPRWVSTTPEAVARRTLRAIRRNRRQVVITPMAHALFVLKRFVPGLIDFANTFSRKRLRAVLPWSFRKTAQQSSTSRAAASLSSAARAAVSGGAAACDGAVSGKSGVPQRSVPQWSVPPAEVVALPRATAIPRSSDSGGQRRAA